MSRISDILIDALSQHKFDEGNVGQFIRFLEEDDQIRYQIWHEMEQEYRRRDLEYRIDQYNQVHDTDVTFNEDEMSVMLEEYNDAIDDSDDWYYMCMGIAEKWCRDKVDGNE